MRIRFVLVLAAFATGLLAGCGQQTGGAMPGTARVTPTAMGAMVGMDHSASPMDSSAPYDASFIDNMIVHHQGAIVMAKEAQTQSKRPEILKLAGDIIAAQQTEIAQMQTWRAQWYPDLPVTKGMGMDMGTMTVAGDASVPFDLRFIDAMIPHHQSAVSMAKDAEQKATKPEIKQLAGAIIKAQDSEIAQMQGWKKTWFNQ